MARLDDLAERIDRLLLRHDELQRTHALLQAELAAALHERDSLRSRLAAARARIDNLLDRLPGSAVPAGLLSAPSPPAAVAERPPAPEAHQGAVE